VRKSLLAFIASGKGFVGIHDAIATFVQYPVYDQWPPFGQMLGATENGGHPWDGETMTVRVEDPKSPLNAVFHGEEFQIADQAFQFQEPTLRDHLHVLLSIDVEKTGFFPNHHILPVRMADKDFPVTWIRAMGRAASSIARWDMVRPSSGSSLTWSSVKPSAPSTAGYVS